LTQNDIIKLTIRRNIYNYILNNPGIHISQISQDLKIPRTTLLYHLNYLEKKEIVYVKNTTSFRRYYTNGKLSAREKKILSVLQQKIPRKIMLYMILNPDQVGQIEISKYLKKHPTTIAFHIKKLIKIGFIGKTTVGNETKYWVNWESELYEFFIKYKKIMLDLEMPFAMDWWEFIMSSNRIDKMINGVYNVFPHPYHV